MALAEVPTHDQEPDHAESAALEAITRPLETLEVYIPMLAKMAASEGLNNGPILDSFGSSGAIGPTSYFDRPKARRFRRQPKPLWTRWMPRQRPTRTGIRRRDDRAARRKGACRPPPSAPFAAAVGSGPRAMNGRTRCSPGHAATDVSSGPQRTSPRWITRGVD